MKQNEQYHEWEVVNVGVIICKRCLCCKDVGAPICCSACDSVHHYKSLVFMSKIFDSLQAGLAPLIGIGNYNPPILSGQRFSPPHLRIEARLYKYVFECN